MKYLKESGKLSGKTFLPGKQNTRNFGANFSETCGDFSSKFSSFFGCFVQQKDNVNKLCLQYFSRIRLPLIRKGKLLGWQCVGKVLKG